MTGGGRTQGPSVEERVVARVRAAGQGGLPTQAQLVDLVRQADPLLGKPAVADAVARVRALVSGLGPLDALLADEAVSDLLVNGPGPVWVERAGRVEATGVVVDRTTIDGLVERIVGPLGRRVDPASPVVDARLPDGSRVHVVVPPLAVDGPYVTIRRFAARAISVEEAAGPPVARLLRRAVEARANLLVVGGTGSGKTTLLNALASSVPPGERIITVEDAAELRLASDHVVRLETRPASVEGVGAVSCRELVRNALRMRPDRLVVGEVRGAEALDMVQAMNTGHDGSLSTLHANGCEDALRRLETLVLLAGIGLPHDAVRDQIAAAVDLLVHVARCPDGARRVIEVAEVLAPGAGPEADPGRRGIRLLATGDRVLARAQRRGGATGAAAPAG
ncbi:MAG: type secretion system protein, partial [Acidimicrobiales bacterium]|nr:type secretion system protein [Acidimicrobiales bacterium]